MGRSVVITSTFQLDVKMEETPSQMAIIGNLIRNTIGFKTIISFLECSSKFYQLIPTCQTEFRTMYTWYTLRFFFSGTLLPATISEICRVARALHINSNPCGPISFLAMSKNTTPDRWNGETLVRWGSWGAKVLPRSLPKKHATKHQNTRENPSWM